MKVLLIAIYTFFLFFTTTALYTGATTKPTEVDSISYHIPLANAILNGSIFSPRSFHFPNPSYPASTEVLLSVLILFHVPLNMFNVIAWICLALAVHRLTQKLKLNVLTASLCILSVCFLPTVLRLIHTQTADIWLDVFFVSMLSLLVDAPLTAYFYFLLGVTSGMVAGAKFSGPLFVVAAFVVFGKKLLTHRSLLKVVLFLIPFVILGASWYLRNWYAFGSPIYPAGVAGFSRYMQPHWQTLIIRPGGFIQTLNAWFSEYLLWSIAPVVSVWIISQKPSKSVLAFSILGFLCIGIYLIVPGYPFDYNNIVSEVRYSHPAIISMIIAIYMSLQSTDKVMYIIPAAVINSLVFLLPLPYKPKLYIALELVIGLIFTTVYRYRKSLGIIFSKE